MKKNVLIFSLLFAFIDQVIKYFVINYLELYKSIKVIPNFFYLTYTQNDGAAFSILSGGRWFFVVMGVVALILIVKFISIDRHITKYDTVAYSLITGGIIGNLVDRIVYTHVIDYLDFYIFNFDAPIFNFAAMCIVIGAFMILYTLFVRGDLDEDIHGRKRIK